MGKPMSTVYVPDEYGRLVPTQMPTQVGFIGLYAGPEPPEGYLYCDGSAIGRETYSELFEAVGTLYGAGDGTETFNLPDARGVFFRGDGGENNAAMGVRQGDAIRNITGAFNIRGGMSTDTGQTLDLRTTSGAISAEALSPQNANSISFGAGPANLARAPFDASTIAPTASENRPVNMALKPCIRYV